MSYPSYEYECYNPTPLEESPSLVDLMQEYILDCKRSVKVMSELFENLKYVEALGIKNDVALNHMNSQPSLMVELCEALSEDITSNTTKVESLRVAYYEDEHELEGGELYR